MSGGPPLELEDEFGVAGFSASFNPGNHYGTVGEAEFLIEDLGTTSDCDF